MKTRFHLDGARHIFDEETLTFVSFKLNHTRTYYYVKFMTLMSNLLVKYDDVRYVNVSMGACRFIEKDSRNFFETLRYIRVPENEILFLFKRITNICIVSVPLQI